MEKHKNASPVVIEKYDKIFESHNKYEMEYENEVGKQRRWYNASESKK